MYHTIGYLNIGDYNVGTVYLYPSVNADLNRLAVGRFHGTV